MFPEGVLWAVGRCSDVDQREADVPSPAAPLPRLVAGPIIGIKLWQSRGCGQGFPRCCSVLERAQLYRVSGLGFPRSREKGPSASQHWGPFFASGHTAAKHATAKFWQRGHPMKCDAMQYEQYEMRNDRVGIVVAVAITMVLVAFGTPSRSAEPEAFVRPHQRDSRIYTMLVASCPSTAVAGKLAQRLFASLVWEDPVRLMRDRDLKAVRREITASKCVVAAIPKEIDPWTGPATERYEISAAAKPSLHFAVFDTELSNHNRRMHFMAIGASGFIPEGASDA